MVRSNLLKQFLQFDEKLIGCIYSKLPYLLLDNDGFIIGARIPDMMFTSAANLKKYKAKTPDWENKPAFMFPI